MNSLMEKRKVRVKRLATLIRKIFIYLHRVSKDVVEQEKNGRNPNETVHFSTNL